MSNQSNFPNQIKYVSNYKDFISTPFSGEANAICWKRELVGDFSEIVSKAELSDNIIVIDADWLNALDLSDDGHQARVMLLNDLKLMEEHGGSPVLNIIQNYDRDEDFPFFPTDVYSFHVDRSPVPVDTILCTYHGAASEIVPNSQAIQKVLVPEIREELKKLYDGEEEGFEAFLSEYFFDLHYQAKPDAEIINLGIGNIWRLAVDHPQSAVAPCLHRAPMENPGENRLLLIC